MLASRRRQGQPRTLPSFALIRATCEGERSPKGPVGVPPRELERHLRHLSTFRRRASGGREGNVGSWLAVAQRQGGSFRLMTASSLAQLLEPRREHTPEPGPQPRERKQDRGYGFGM